MKENVPSKIINKIDDEYLTIIRPIIENEEFIKRKLYHHHENRSVYGHSLLVSIRAYHLAKSLGLDYYSTAIAGLLHDFYFEDWQTSKIKRTLQNAHGFRHASEALTNSKKYFPNLLNKKIENAILRHMFPLNFIPPLYLESWIICIVDKYCSMEIFNKPQNLYKYIGLKKKDGDYIG